MSNASPLPPTEQKYCPKHPKDKGCHLVLVIWSQRLHSSDQEMELQYQVALHTTAHNHKQSSDVNHELSPSFGAGAYGRLEPTTRGWSCFGFTFGKLSCNLTLYTVYVILDEYFIVFLKDVLGLIDVHVHRSVPSLKPCFSMCTEHSDGIHLILH